MDLSPQRPLPFSICLNSPHSANIGNVTCPHLACACHSLSRCSCSRSCFSNPATVSDHGRVMVYRPKSPIPSANACFPPIPLAVRPAHASIAHASARHFPRPSASQLCDVIPVSVSPRPPRNDGLDAEMAICPEIMEIHTLLAIETTNYQCRRIPSRFLSNHHRSPSNIVVVTRSLTWWCIPSATVRSCLLPCRIA
jgi:hypothetical protein